MLHFRPDLVDFGRVRRNTARSNLKLAFDIAERVFGVIPLLDPEGMYIINTCSYSVFFFGFISRFNRTKLFLVYIFWVFFIEYLFLEWEFFLFLQMWMLKNPTRDLLLPTCRPSMMSFQMSRPLNSPFEKTYVKQPEYSGHNWLIKEQISDFKTFWISKNITIIHSAKVIQTSKLKAHFANDVGLVSKYLYKVDPFVKCIEIYINY